MSGEALLSSPRPAGRLSASGRKTFTAVQGRQLRRLLRARPSPWWASRAPARPPSAGPSCASTPPRLGRDPVRRPADHRPDPDASSSGAVRQKIQMIFQDPMASPQRAGQDRLHRLRGPRTTSGSSGTRRSGGPRWSGPSWRWASCRSSPAASPTSSPAASASASASPGPWSWSPSS
ncbi:MAG: hypothetical protein MZV65_15935 [Chromatiales bacterium]|nr:hypothetical protein [Chromatiales bacterium]